MIDAELPSRGLAPGKRQGARAAAPMRTVPAILIARHGRQAHPTRRDRPDNTTETLIERIHRLADLRDKRSAHGGGSSRSRHLSYHDILEAQWIAAAIVFAVLDAVGVLASGLSPQQREVALPVYAGRQAQSRSKA
jgi:hypothetical protein